MFVSIYHYRRGSGTVGTPNAVNSYVSLPKVWIMKSKNGSEVIQELDVLAEDHVPADIVGRERQIAALQDCMWPVVKKSRPLHAWLYGETGTGKTSVAKHVLASLKKDMGVSGVYVNCWEHNTLYTVADKVVYDLRLLGAAKSLSVVKLEILMRHLGNKPFVLVLDEIDKPSPSNRNTILYNLLMLPFVGLICIANSRESLVGLEDRVRSRLNPRLVDFNSYSTKKLSTILEHRARGALNPDAWNSELINHVSRKSDGSARVAIQTMRQAAMLAESGGANKITGEHVTGVLTRVQQLEKTYALRQLTEHHRLLHEIIKESGEIVSGELWRTYLMKCEERKIKPIALRTFSPYINRLVTNGLVTAERIASWTKARRFRLQ